MTRIDQLTRSMVSSPVAARFALILTFVSVACSCPAQESVEFDRNIRHAEVLTAAGVTPAQQVSVGDVLFELSPPFELDRSHQIAVAWVTAKEQHAIRVLYRSNSQCSWRMCDSVTPNHIGKGFHEFDKQVPIAVSLALLRSHDETGTLKPWAAGAKEAPSQHQLAGRLLTLLTIDRDTGLKSGQVLKVDGGYVTREYASVIPSFPVPLSAIRGHLRTAGGGSVADPKATELPPQARLPELSHEIDSAEFVIPSHAQHTRSSGKLTAHVFASHDKTLHYCFVEDEQGRIMLSGVELANASVSSLGLRTQYLDTTGMDAPLLEYAAQIPEQYGGKRKYRYQPAWNWVREQPIIQYYFRQLDRQIPPVIDVARLQD